MITSFIIGEMDRTVKTVLHRNVPPWGRISGVTSNQFLDLACQWAFDHESLLVSDEMFLPPVKNRGLSDSEIHRIKNELEGVHIQNHSVIGGWADFSILRPTFGNYIRRTRPDEYRRAHEINTAWCREGKNITASQLAIELGLSERDGRYLLSALNWV
jgi:hypothetical protein